MVSQEDLHGESITDPVNFWGEAAKAISWEKAWSNVLDDSNPPLYRWFEGGMLNTCYNAVDRHAEGARAGQAALIYDSPVTDRKMTLTYSELRDRVARFAGVLSGIGVGHRDRVVIYMPMVPETVIAMLACARLGAVHSVVFGGFAPKELSTRIDDARPRVIVSASCGIEGDRIVSYKPLLDGAIARSAHKPERCVILQRPMLQAEMVQGRDIDWEDSVADARPHDCVPVAATDPLYILYTSGTTGQPKGVVRDNGGHAVALHWSMKNIYDVDPGEVFWAASDLGWVVGHSYIVYGPLIHGNTTVLFEGKPVGTPDAGVFWRVIAEHNVTTLFTAPTAFRAIKQHDPDGELLQSYQMPKFRALFLAGEHCDPATLHWAEEQLGVPVVDHWWQTETGWPMTASSLSLGCPIRPGSAGRPVPGWDLGVVDAAGNPVRSSTMGDIVCRLPLPPGSLPTLWQNDEDFRKTYLTKFSGHFVTGDAGYFDADGYLFVMSRTDDIINVAGHRLSTGAMEEVLISHPDVAECAVIGAADPLKGQLPVGFLVLNAGVEREHSVIVQEVIQLVREEIGPVASFKRATVVDRLPKTRSGKIVRGTMCKIADGRDYTIPATIDDPKTLDEITSALDDLGYPCN